MNMAIPHKTAAEIRARLQEIRTAEAQHAARDLDREVHEAMIAGGDLDALEEVHLQAERLARRLRVEKAGLSAELLLAVRREAEESLRSVVREHDDLAAGAAKRRDALCKAWSAFAAELKTWAELQDRAVSITEHAERLAREHGLTFKELGPFQSERVSAICRDSQAVWGTLLLATQKSQIGNRVQSHVLDSATD